MKKFGFAVLLLAAALFALPAAEAGAKKILMVVTSADQMSNGEATGVWLEEFAVPYLLFRSEGYKITVASPKGGKTPVDERSLENGVEVYTWAETIMQLNDTQLLSKMKASKFDAVFIPGGHGSIVDFPKDETLRQLLQDFESNDKVIASVCHGPAAFVGVKKVDGAALVSGKTITAFTDAEEVAVQLDKVVPFLLESELRAEGANFIAGDMWAPHVQIDGKLVTGQNPASSRKTAEAVISLLK